ncbi:hypothetical protein [Curtobacterium caseinilyticum]|uniref:ABC transporter permease n=1 Tax=Curtobacterium caseinilyticum TaxID=3055137 RepID=A0ABT7TS27_9MICO|nr:hypothetical protein [Curtobacterium caseinilyticum]MDM7892408.1 hypothetical protein [Curtobacterium caseinilyticum]
MTVTLSRSGPVPVGTAPAAATLRPLPTRTARWLLRAALASPYVVLALIAGQATPTTLLGLTGNQVTLERATTALDAGVVQAIGQLYPLLSGVLLRFMPFGAQGAAVLGGLVAGVLLQLLAQDMLRRGLRMREVVAFTIALGANPLYAFVALNDLQAFLGIALFALAVVDMVRFFAWGDTQAGFRAGLALMLSTLVDPMGFVYVGIAALAAPVLDLARHEQRGIRQANVLVLVFPSVAVAVSIAALDWMVLHDPLAAIRGTVDVSEQRLAGLQHLFATADGLLLVAMVVAGATLALLVGRPGAIALVVALFGGVIGGYAIGLVPVAAAGNVFVTMLSVAIAILPPVRGRVTSTLVVVLAVLQVPLAWAAAFQRQVVVEWMHALVAVVLR